MSFKSARNLFFLLFVLILIPDTSSELFDEDDPVLLERITRMLEEDEGLRYHQYREEHLLPSSKDIDGSGEFETNLELIRSHVLPSTSSTPVSSIDRSGHLFLLSHQTDQCPSRAINSLAVVFHAMP